MADWGYVLRKHYSMLVTHLSLGDFNRILDHLYGEEVLSAHSYENLLAFEHDSPEMVRQRVRSLLRYLHLSLNKDKLRIFLDALKDAALTEVAQLIGRDLHQFEVSMINGTLPAACPLPEPCQVAELLPSSTPAYPDEALSSRNEAMDYDTTDAVSVPSDLKIAAVPGEQLNIDYNVVLGTGSDDVIVYKGRYGDVDVAVKVFGCQLDNGDPAPELPTHMKPYHPNFFTLYDIAQFMAKMGIILELGYADLKTRANIRKRSNAPRLEDSTALKYLSDIRHPLDLHLHTLYIHGKEVSHRDVKPKNILIFGNPSRLADLGLSTFTVLCATKSACSQIGTKMYKPPESFERSRPSEKSDVWALGMTIIEVPTGAEKTRHACAEPSKKTQSKADDAQLTRRLFSPKEPAYQTPENEDEFLDDLNRSLNEVGMRSKVIAPSLSNPGHYTVYAKGVDKEGVRGAVNRLTTDNKYSHFSTELVEDETEELLKPLSSSVTIDSKSSAKTSSSDLNLYDSKKKQHYLITTAHGLLSDKQMLQCDAYRDSLLVNQALADSKYSLKPEISALTAMEVRSSPVVCFQQTMNEEQRWSGNCLMDLGAIPISEERLKQLAGSKTLTLAPVAEATIKVMDKDGLRRIIGAEGIIRRKRGKVHPSLIIYPDGEHRIGHNIAFKLDDLHDKLQKGDSGSTLCIFQQKNGKEEKLPVGLLGYDKREFNNIYLISPLSPCLLKLIDHDVQCDQVVQQ